MSKDVVWKTNVDREKNQSSRGLAELGITGCKSMDHETQNYPVWEIVSAGVYTGNIDSTRRLENKKK